MKRLMDAMVRLGLTIACRFAAWPTRRSPDSVNATTDGVVRPPSGLLITSGLPPSKIATTEFVVPRSIPMTLSVVFAMPVASQARCQRKSSAVTRAFSEVYGQRARLVANRSCRPDTARSKGVTRGTSSSASASCVGPHRLCHGPLTPLRQTQSRLGQCRGNRDWA